MKKTLVALLAALLVLVACCAVASAAPKTVVCDQCKTTVCNVMTYEPATCQTGTVVFYHCPTCDRSASTELNDKKTCADLITEKKLWTVTVAPTCKTEGTRTGTCPNPDCGKVVTQTIPKDESAHTLGEMTEATPATCAKEGWGFKECTNKCGYTETVVIPKTTDHVFVTKTITPATCEKDGRADEVCKVCGMTKAANLLPKTGHDFGEVYTKTPATCTTTGISYQVCRKCLKVLTKTIPALGHEYEPTDVITKKASTCNTKGIAEVYCTRCKKTVTFELPYVGHAWKVQEVTNETGHWTTRYCSYCKMTQYKDDMNNDWHTASKGAAIQNTFTKKADAVKQEVKAGTKATTKTSTKAAKASAASAKANGSGVSVPKTNDNTSTLPFVMMGIALVGIVALVASKRKVNG